MTSKPLKFALAGAALMMAVSQGAGAIVFDPFNPIGVSGSLNGQAFTIGASGVVFEYDTYLNVDGLTLNPVFGTSGQFAFDLAEIAAAGIGVTFSPTLSNVDQELLLSYEITNNSGGALMDVTLLPYLDVDIFGATAADNEFAETTGTLLPGQGFEVDVPTGFNPEIIDNLLLGALDGTNAIPGPALDDVAMALSFNLGTLADGETRTVEILISENLSSLGCFAITQRDGNPNEQTTITFSGQEPGTVPPVCPSASPSRVSEPGPALLLGLGLLGMVYRCRSSCR